MDNFYGRQDVLELLNKRVNAFSEGYRQNIAIIGDELIGKTTLIHYWLSRYTNNYIVPIYVEIQPQELRELLQKFIGRLLHGFLQNSSITLREDISFLLEESQNYIPETARLIKELLYENKKKRSEDVFIRLLELTEVFSKETGKRCCIIFDEFHRLEELKIKDLYSHWRKTIMTQKNTMYILLSSRKILASEILSSDMDMLFGNFQKIELLPLDIKTTQLFIRDRLEGSDIRDSLLNFIADFSSARPFYLNIFTCALLDYHIKKPDTPLSIDSFVISVEDIFLDRWGVLFRRFSDTLNDLKESIYRELLIVLASGLRRLPEIAGRLHKTKKEISLALNQLLKLDMVSKIADVYLLTDRVFGFWLKNVYSVHINAFGMDELKKREIFRKELGSVFDAFKNAHQKDISERIVELFNQFSGESIELQKKRMRLNNFKEVKLININGKNIKEGVLGRAAGSLWIAGLKEDDNAVLEEDIIEFIDVCKRLNYNKQQKRIFIIFDEIDPNAKLLAKEGKVTTWDVSFLNSLFDIYGKQRIIR